MATIINEQDQDGSIIQRVSFPSWIRARAVLLHWGVIFMVLRLQSAPGLFGKVNHRLLLSTSSITPGWGSSPTQRYKISHEKIAHFPPWPHPKRAILGKRHRLSCSIRALGFCVMDPSRRGNVLPIRH